MRAPRIVALAAAAALAAGCNADPTHTSRERGGVMGGSGGYTAPAGPRLEGSQMGGSGGYAPVDSTQIGGTTGSLSPAGAPWDGSGGTVTLPGE